MFWYSYILYVWVLLFLCGQKNNLTVHMLEDGRPIWNCWQRLSYSNVTILLFLFFPSPTVGRWCFTRILEQVSVSALLRLNSSSCKHVDMPKACFSKSIPFILTWFWEIKIFMIFIIFFIFLGHISSPSPVFPWSSWAHIKAAQSSNIFLKVLLGICQSVKYFYQKYMVKGSKLCTSAGRPKTSRRPT